MALPYVENSERTEDSDTMYGGSVRCFMEILIRKVENNRATSKSRLEGRTEELQEGAEELSAGVVTRASRENK